jgi:hypothetical protein
MSNKRELSRAEQVRRRRAELAAKELQETKARALKPMVKVTSRTPTIPMSAAPRKKKQPRRFNAALGMPSIHLHMPRVSLPKFSFSMPRLQMNWRMGSFLIAILLGVAIYLVLTLPYFYVPAATVLGNNRLTGEEINGVLGVSGQSIFTVQPEELRARLLLSYPELLTVQVQVALPNQVSVTVTERQPVIFLELEGQGYTWVDANGVAFRPRGMAEGLVRLVALDTLPAGIPPADQFSPPPYMSKDLVEAIRILLPLVPENTPLTFSAADGLGWTDPRGWQAAFGTSVQNMPLKMRVYQSLVDSLIARGIRPAYINVKYPDGPFYRMTKPSESNTGQ